MNPSSIGLKWALNKDQGWLHAWTWRRSFDPSANRSLYSVNDGDISLQVMGNDLVRTQSALVPSGSASLGLMIVSVAQDTGYLFLPLADVKLEARRG